MAGTTGPQNPRDQFYPTVPSGTVNQKVPVPFFACPFLRLYGGLFRHFDVFAGITFLGYCRRTPMKTLASL
ncbi:hypothetical protein Poly21_15510 [Allorhodopirellula heiligendammensis]|uniref:Uncharacterized protein n=1 Tax=Allorhodopirellula heiligendammensis TaxID=2714739 RepID=A0A5C6C9D4_9BACT|nr:hypothetical protein Poly21_15510 [Allorhodopirellula heiligendammensis]